MHKFKWQQRTKRFILVLVSLLTLVSILITGVSSYAITPDGAYIGTITGTGLTIGARNSRDRKNASKKDELRPNTILYVPGNRSWANLGFFEDSPKDHTGLLVQAGPSEMISEWSFPCSAKGRLTINWKEGDKRGCEEGVKVQSSSKRGRLLNNNIQVSRRLLAQAEEEVTVVPTPGQSIIQTADSAAGISVSVLVGDVRVKSARNPVGRLVKAGERYNYPQDTITPIDINPIVNSPEMQDFLNPDNWSSPDIPQRIADGFSKQLREMLNARRGSPAVASNSGNNNNSGQPPLSQSPQRTATQSTQPQPQAENPGYSDSDRAGICTFIYHLTSSIIVTAVENGLPEDPCRDRRLLEDSRCSTKPEQCEFIASTYLLHGQNQVLLSCKGYSQTFVGIGYEPIGQARSVREAIREKEDKEPGFSCVIKVIGSSPQPPQPITP